MQPYPHNYVATAAAGAAGNVAVTSPRLPDLETAPPAEFDGPGDRWSPEALLVAAVADCLILTFRAIARASKLEWTHLEWSVDGTLDKRDGVTQFTKFATRAQLTVPAGTDETRARLLLEKAEHVCLVSNSLKGERTLDAIVVKASQ